MWDAERTRFFPKAGIITNSRHVWRVRVCVRERKGKGERKCLPITEGTIHVCVLTECVLLSCWEPNEQYHRHIVYISFQFTMPPPLQHRPLIAWKQGFTVLILKEMHHIWGNCTHILLNLQLKTQVVNCLKSPQRISQWWNWPNVYFLFFFTKPCVALWLIHRKPVTKERERTHLSEFWLRTLWPLLP